MKINNYIQKPDKLQAVRLTKHNIHKVADWCNGIPVVHVYIQCRVIYKIGTKWVFLYEGEWLVKNKYDEFNNYANKYFLKYFKKIK